MNIENNLSPSWWSGWKQAVWNKKYICKDGSRLPIPLSAALAKVEETAELIRTEVEETAELSHQYLALTATVPTHLLLQNLLHQLLDCMRQVMAVDTVAVLLQTEDGQQLAVCATLGLEQEITQGIRIPLGRGFAGRIAATCKRTTVDDLSTVEVVSPILRNKGLQSMLGVPLLVKDQVIGVFHVGTFRPRKFTKKDAQLLQLIADRLALAIDRLAIPKPSPSITKGSALVRVHWHPTSLLDLALPLLQLVLDLLLTVMSRCRAFFYHFKDCQMPGELALAA